MKTRVLVRCAVLTALLCVLSLLAIPMPGGAPLTLQVFGAALCGFVLGKKQGSLAVVVYLLVGAMGLPVFSGLRGGASVLLGPTGGFLFGFLALSFFCGLARETKKPLVAAFGLLLCHALGVLQLSLVAAISPWGAFMAASLPFIVKDVLLLVGAWGIARLVLKHKAV